MAVHDKRRNPRRRFPVTVAYTTLLLAFSVYVLLDAFVIARSYGTVETAVVSQTAEAASTLTDEDNATSAGELLTQEEEDSASSTETATASTSTTLTEVRYGDSTVYVVDVYTDDIAELLAAFAQDTYGKNVTATTSEMAASVGATVAINGDYYGARNAGYVVRNGVLYRDTVASDDQEDLVIYADGSFDIICEGEVSAQELVDAGAWQVFSFGPGLVEDGTMLVDADDEVGRARSSNPRTALGKVSDGHYVLVVADGRSDESEGLSLLELATFMTEELGVKCAYNLDGGGSSTLWYQGSIINNPTTTGRKSKERSVSDIVYLTI